MSPKRTNLPGKGKAKASSTSKSGKVPGKTARKALPAGKKAKANKGRRQSTKKAGSGSGTGNPPDPPVVDPKIVALRQVADWILRG